MDNLEYKLKLLKEMHDILSKDYLNDGDIPEIPESMAPELATGQRYVYKRILRWFESMIEGTEKDLESDLKTTPPEGLT